MQAPPLYPPRRRVFGLFFTAVQTAFASWLAWATIAAARTPAACGGQGCGEGEHVRAAFTALAVLLIWTLTDVILASCYVVYRAATRRP
jgi:hypothetical protein